MKKMPTLFVRKFDQENPNGTPKHGSKFTLTEQVTPGCEWVLNGEGIATRKWDGTCVLIDGGLPYKRYDAKHGKTLPDAFIPAQTESDPITGHWPGWVPLDMYPDKWIQEAVNNSVHYPADGTYEAVGPKINGNKDNVASHILIKHGAYHLHEFDPSFDGIRTFLTGVPIEGIVFHHPDGRMCKIKRSDFGLKW